MKLLRALTAVAVSYSVLVAAAPTPTSKTLRRRGCSQSSCPNVPKDEHHQLQQKPYRATVSPPKAGRPAEKNNRSRPPDINQQPQSQLVHQTNQAFIPPPPLQSKSQSQGSSISGRESRVIRINDDAAKTEIANRDEKRAAKEAEERSKWLWQPPQLDRPIYTAPPHFNERTRRRASSAASHNPQSGGGRRTRGSTSTGSTRNQRSSTGTTAEQKGEGLKFSLPRSESPAEDL